MAQDTTRTDNLREMARRRSAALLVGRGREKQRLLETIDPGGPLLLYVHGIAGIGKSTLLAGFAEEARSLGATVVQLDCRTIEPTERGFLHSVALATGAATPTLEAICTRLGNTDGMVVLVFDTYEVFRFFDGWIRENFIPELPGNVRVILSGREPPVTGWLASPEWQGAFQTMRLEALDEREACELLGHAGLSLDEARHVNRFAHGHPLALTLAITTHAERPDLDLAGQAMPSVLTSLVELFLADVKDAATREALEAAAVVRRVTLSLLRAMLPDALPQDMLERLQALPFVVVGRDGLILHDAVREAISTYLKAQNPARHEDLRRRAWVQLRHEVARVGLDELWRYTADLLYVLENPLVREAFFPSNGPQYFVRKAVAADREAVLNIVRLHEPPEILAVMEKWWERLPDAFYAVLDVESRVVAFYMGFEPSNVDRVWLQEDPLTRDWCAHLKEHPVPARQKVLFMRRWLTEETGEMPSAAQGACWLDIKRLYMYLRPHLRRIYFTVTEAGLQAYGEVVQRLGFVPIGTTVAGETYYSTINDFGPESVDGWLAGLIAAELGITEQGLLDREARELVVEHGRIALTKLEFAVLEYLDDRKGRAVSRSALLNDVWGYSYNGGSNVLEVVIRSLRKKLGGQASAIETVTGIGYRLKG